MPTWSSSKKWPSNNVSVQLMTRNMAEPNSMGQPVRNMGLHPHSEDNGVGVFVRLGSAMDSSTAPSKALATSDVA